MFISATVDRYYTVSEREVCSIRVLYCSNEVIKIFIWSLSKLSLSREHWFIHSSPLNLIFSLITATSVVYFPDFIQTQNWVFVAFPTSLLLRYESFRQLYFVTWYLAAIHSPIAQIRSIILWERKKCKINNILINNM